MRSWSNTRTCAGGSCTGSGTYVGPGGKVVTRSGTATYGNGGWQAQGTVTGPRGGTGNYQASGSCAGGACSSSGTWTGPNGGVWSSNSTLARTGNGWERDVSVTAPNGANWTRSGAGSCAGGVCNSAEPSPVRAETPGRMAAARGGRARGNQSLGTSRVLVQNETQKRLLRSSGLFMIAA